MSAPRERIVGVDDPFEEGDAGRPWVIVNIPEIPFHGEQYVVLALSTRTWYDERLPIADDDLLAGGSGGEFDPHMGGRSIPRTSAGSWVGWTNGWSTTRSVHSRAISAFAPNPIGDRDPIPDRRAVCVPDGSRRFSR
ncbi:hypothetical protein [Natronorarus salvus]|uniref:hypothetical protein n=1 Tax=Natronorarus salvus TaxID=3117733 RepID=UPI002F26C200